MAYNLTIAQFQHISKIAQSQMDELDKEVEVVAYLKGCTTEELMNTDLNKIRKVFADCGFRSPSTKINKYIWVKGKLYKGLTDITKPNFKAGQYIDLKNFANQSITDNLHNLAAIIYRPVFGKYDHKHISEDMKSAKLNDVYGLVFFYSRVSEILKPTIQMSLVLAAHDIKEMMREIERESLDL